VKPHHSTARGDRGKHSMANMHYRHLAIMMGLSFISMFALMYAMVDSFANVFVNLNQVYMAALMVAPMVIIELVIMRAMYSNKRLNVMIAAGTVAVFIGSWLLIRQQGAISDAQFLRSMIPHHAGAILMCKEASLQDQRIKDLCKSIIEGQQAEIDLMKAKLQELK
jgi:uncharacterized protein (DUF305 family)